MENTINCNNINSSDGRELGSENVQIRLSGHCIICLRKVSTKRIRNSKSYGESSPPEVAPKSVVTRPGFLTTFNQVWTVLYAKWRKKKTRAKDDGSMEEIEISLESVLQTGCVSTNVRFSKAPTICQLCCDKVLTVENLMKAVRQQVREINMLLEEGRNRQGTGSGDFEKALREEGLEENVIRATLQFVEIFDSRYSEQNDILQDLESEGDKWSSAASVNMPNNITEMECDEENSLVRSQMDSDDNDEGSTGGLGDDDMDYIKLEEDLEEDDDDDDESEDEMEDEEEEDKNDPEYKVGKDPLTVFPNKPEEKKFSPRKVATKLTSSEQVENTDEKNMFPCSCGKSFAKRKARSQHIRNNKKLHPEYKRFRNFEGRRRPVCELCGERVLFSELLQHYTDHLNGQAEWVLRCPNDKCGFMYVSNYSLNKHVHGEKTKECTRSWREKCGPICDICGFKGGNMLKIMNHVRDKHENGGEKNLRCPISGCGKMFCVRQSVNEHLYEHRYRPPETEQVCDKCGGKFKFEGMEEHLKKEHGIEEVIGCGQCELKFSERDEMVDHLFEHRGTGIFCDICGDKQDKFSNYGVFREHYFAVHKLCPKRYKCVEGDCGKWFWRKGTKEDHDLKFHRKNNIGKRYGEQRGKGEKRCECDVCNVRFVTEVSLIKHNIKVHDEDPFRCDLCGETFDEKVKLNRHKKEHAGIVFEKEWRCEVEGCGKVFSVKKNFTRHREVGHGAVKKHVCELCGKGYSDACGLRGHRDAVHLGLRPCVCDECGERFASSSILKKHKVIHTGKRPFACDICGQGFKYKQVLATHVRGHEEKGTGFKPNGPMKKMRKRKGE